MRYITTVFLTLLISACAINSVSKNSVAADEFDREAALVSYKDQCSLNLVLAMGLSAQKEQGGSRAKLESVAASSKNPELMIPMVSELFGLPQLQGRTYIFYKYDNCLISRANSQQLVSIDKIRPVLVQCESKHQNMDGLIVCIDRVIINATKEFK